MGDIVGVIGVIIGVIGVKVEGGFGCRLSGLEVSTL